MLGDLSLYGWLAGIVGALVAALALKSRSAMSDKVKEQERRVDAINNAQEKRDEVDALGSNDLVSRAAEWVRNRKG